VAGETEVVAKAQRRRFTAEHKRRILREADRCTHPGEIGALLRREGLYSSHLTTWRAARDRGELAGLAPKRRGPKATPPDPRDKQIAEEEREIPRWKQRAERAEALVELPAREREVMIATVREVGPRLGVAPTCAALGGSPCLYSTSAAAFSAVTAAGTPA
jgi:transposase-like protein